MRRDPKSNTGFDIWALPMSPEKSGDRKPFPVVATNFVDSSKKIAKGSALFRVLREAVRIFL